MNAPGWLTGYAPDGAPYLLRSGQRWGACASHLGDYMRRWMLRTPWGELRIHRILRPDAGQDHHDHPWDFTSLILRGAYAEELIGPRGLGVHVHRAGALVRRRADQAHRITWVAPGTITLVIAGPRQRSWGFVTASGWIPWRTYVQRSQA